MLKNIYLSLMALMYLFIGIWAIFDNEFNSSFLEVIGLTVSNQLGVSEIAGIYGGLNLSIGITCIIGLFKKNIAFFIIKFITFLVGSIAFGRVLSSMYLTNLDFFNSYFVFEIIAFTLGIFLIKRDLYNIAKN